MRILTYTVTPEEDGRMVKGILRGSLQHKRFSKKNDEP